MIDATDSQMAALAGLVESLAVADATMNAMRAARDGLLAVAGRVALDIAVQAGEQSDSGDMVLRAVSAEIGQRLRVSDRTVQRWIGEASTLVEVFPAVWQAQGAGLISAGHARVIIDAGSHLSDPAHRAAFVQAVLPLAETESPNRFRPLARRIAERFEAIPIDERHRRARTRRRVWVRDGDDAMAEFTWYGPAVLAHGMMDRLTQMAHQIRAANRAAVAQAKAFGLPFEPDARSLDEIRADLLAELVLMGAPTGHDDLDDVLAEIRAHVEITLPVFSVIHHDAGGSDPMHGADAHVRNDAGMPDDTAADDDRRAEQPAGDGRGTEQPADDSHSTEQPADDSHSTEQPVDDDRRTEQPADEDRRTEQAASDAHSTEQPVDDDRRTKQPADDDRGTDRPAGDDHADSAHRTAGLDRDATGMRDHEHVRTPSADVDTAGSTDPPGPPDHPVSDVPPGSENLPDGSSSLLPDGSSSVRPDAHATTTAGPAPGKDSALSPAHAPYVGHAPSRSAAVGPNTARPATPTRDAIAFPPPMLNGVIPIDVDTARRLAGTVSGWDRVLTHPITGAVLATDRYRPSAQLKRHLTARDQRCRFPTCGQPARDCDLDHTHPAAAGGDTRDTNLAALCRRHHVLKHTSPWHARQLSGGRIEWTSPTGGVYVDTPPPPHTIVIVPATRPDYSFTDLDALADAARAPF